MWSLTIVVRSWDFFLGGLWLINQNKTTWIVTMNYFIMSKHYYCPKTTINQNWRCFSSPNSIICVCLIFLFAPIHLCDIITSLPDFWSCSYFPKEFGGKYNFETWTACYPCSNAHETKCTACHKFLFWWILKMNAYKLLK